MAEDEPFAIRFGLIMLEPTADPETMGFTHEVGTSFGGEFDFEWYALRRLGLEGSIASAFDGTVNSAGDTASGIIISPLTIGLNFHVIRTRTVDWSFGAVGGVMFFHDFDFNEFDDTMTLKVKSGSSGTYGIQTSLDVGFAGEGRWGMNFGIKYLDADLESQSLPDTVAVDPVIVRVMGLFRW